VVLAGRAAAVAVDALWCCLQSRFEETDKNMRALQAETALHKGKTAQMARSLQVRVTPPSRRTPAPADGVRAAGRR
jgi:hypothetical protein